MDLKTGDQLVTMDNISLASLDHSEIIKMIQKVIYTLHLSYYPLWSLVGFSEWACSSSYQENNSNRYTP